MATMKKKIISIILITVLSISLILGDAYKVKAMATAGVVLSGLAIVTAAVIAAEQSEDYQTWYENLYRPRYQDAINQLFQRVGFITGTEKIANFISTFGGDPIQNARIWLAQESGVNENQITDNEVKQALYNMYKNCNIDSNNDSFQFSNDLRSYTQYIANGIIDNSSYKYVNGYSLPNAIQGFSSSLEYNACSRFLTNHASAYVNMFVKTPSKHYIATSENTNIAFVKTTTLSREYGIAFYDSQTWERVRLNNLDYFTWFEYDSNSNEYVESQNPFVDNYIFVQKEYIYDLSFLDAGFNNEFLPVSAKGNNTYKMYMSFEDMKADSVGVSPYYLSKTWNDFSTSNSTYTVDNSNVNNITYGDVISYVNSFNTENGSYPSPTEIQIIIDQNEPGGNGGNNNPGGEDISGGSSSATATANNEGINININNNHNINIGGSTVSGNGSGTNSGIGDIFGFLSGIGEALASLVKNLGTALADLIQSLAEVINDIVVGIPDIFSGLINIVFGGLPDDLKSVIILGITVMVVYGLVKLIRG